MKPDKVNYVSYVQKVLPLVYDESLSYYEVLCKLQNSHNALVDFVNGEWTETSKELFQQFLQKLFFDASYNKKTETLTFDFKAYNEED